MSEKIKLYFKNYFRKRKPFAIVTDILFWILVLLLLIPTTRVPVSAFFIRLTSFAPSELSVKKQFKVSENTLRWEVTDNRSGKPITFSKLLDKPVFVNLWATWCPPCRAELPGIQKLYEQYEGKVHFLLLSDDPPEKVGAFAKKHDYGGLPFFRYRYLPEDFNTQTIPTTFVVSKKGEVVLIKKGAARWNSGKVKKLLDNLIGQ
jgi:thiol-disulfide isomerase/thioredoxin